MRLPIELIGNKIRAIRKEKGLTLEMMAAKTGLSKGLLSQVERGVSQPSLESLWRITRALESSIVCFFEEIEQHRVHVVRKDKRRRIQFPDSSGTYSLLSAGGGRLGMLEVRLRPGEAVRDRFIQQEGEECLVVTGGEVEVLVGDEELRLQTGDSLLFDGSQPRVVTNTGKEEAVIVWSFNSPLV